MILLHRIEFECVLAVDHVSYLSVVVSSWVYESSLIKWFMLLEYSWLAMVVRWEY